MLKEVLIMILKPLKLNCFIKQFKINYIGQLQGIQLLKL